MPDFTTNQQDPEQLQQSPDEAVAAEKKKLHKRLRHSIDATKQHRRKLIYDWQLNVDYRRGKPFATQSDEDRVSVPMDWSLTKEKESQLFSQVPAVRVNHAPHTISDEALPWVHGFETKINDTLISAGIEAAMTECIPDCINAAGIGVVMVAREAITKMEKLPAIDINLLPPELQAQIMKTGKLPSGEEVPMTEVPRVLDAKYVVTRISPADFLWPLSFSGSDFDRAPWLGRSGRSSWNEAKRRFNLSDADKEKVVSQNKTTADSITHLSTDTEKKDELYDESVSFDEIFYSEACYNPDVTSFAAIHHLVFVDGKEEPVVDEPWKGQQENPETGLLLGALKYPIRVLTLSYITDDAIPPSDSAIGRPQVDEINKARTQMIRQRERSIPIRWFDVNRVDPTIQYALMKGTWQGMIPVQGVGTNIIGEVARSAMPPENFVFDRIAKGDLMQFWQTGPGQWGADIETKAEVQAIGSTMDVRVARERAKVGNFFVGIAEVLGGLLSIFEDPSTFGEGFTPEVSRALAYSILADSTVLLDSNQRRKRLIEFVNFGAKSGVVDIISVMKEIATLTGLDPAVVIKAPEPRPPVEPNISVRLTGTEDLMNPLVLAFLMKSGQAPDPKLIEEAKKLIEIGVTPPVPPPMPMGGPDGPPMDLAGGPTPLDGPVPEPPPPLIGDANPQWQAMNRINARTLEREKT